MTVNGDGVDDIIVGSASNSSDIDSKSYVFFDQRSPFATRVDISGLEGSYLILADRCIVALSLRRPCFSRLASSANLTHQVRIL